MANKRILTKKIEKRYLDLNDKFNRNTKTYMNKNNKKKLLQLLYEQQLNIIEFETKYKDGDDAAKEYASYEMYDTAKYVRMFIDNYDNMTSDEKDYYLDHIAENGRGTHEVDMVNNKYLTKEEIALIMKN